jgi:diguanylate cyclase
MNAFKIAENLRKEISLLKLCFDDKDIMITISAGLSSMAHTVGTQTDQLLRRADEALYMAKRTGRNRVCVFDDVRSEGADHAG